MDLGVIAMKRYSAFSKTPGLLEPYCQIVLCYIQDTCWGSLTPLQRCSRCILQPTGQEYLLNAAQSNFRRTSYAKAKLDNTQKYNMCKSEHGRVGKVIDWELCKRLKFDHTHKWYMCKPESVLENEMHEILMNSLNPGQTTRPRVD